MEFLHGKFLYTSASTETSYSTHTYLHMITYFSNPVPGIHEFLRESFELKDRFQEYSQKILHAVKEDFLKKLAGRKKGKKKKKKNQDVVFVGIHSRLAHSNCGVFIITRQIIM